MTGESSFTENAGAAIVLRRPEISILPDLPGLPLMA
jgi:hypothetical protein